MTIATQKLKLSPLALLAENQSCEHCVDGLMAVLLREVGISQVHRDEDGLFCLHYEQGRWNVEGLMQTAQQYGAQMLQACQRRVWRVSGMDCGGCVRTVEEGVRSLPGVLAVEAHLATGKVAIQFEKVRVNEQQLQERLAFLGHAVEEEKVRKGGEAEEERSRVARWGERLLSREWRPLVSGSLFALLGMLSLWLGGPAWLTNGGFGLAIVAGGWDIFPTGLRQLVASRRLTIDLLMSIAAIGAFLLGEFAEGAAVVLLFNLGEMLEGVTMERARRSIRSLMSLAPNEATRLLADGISEEVPVAELLIGDRLLVRPGERIPMDGVVLAGRSAVDQSPITGESMPVGREVGDELFAGSINGHGALEMRVTRRAEDNTIARVITMVEEAQSRRAPIQRFVDRFAEWYTPAVVLGALLLAFLSPLFLGWSWETSIHRALVLLVISCPCALVISTPVSLMAALSNAARQGVLIKGGSYLETLSQVQVVAFDKTGTLTQGRPKVTDLLPFGKMSEEELLRLVAAVEQQSEHPLATAIREAATEQGLSLPTSFQFEALPGRGAQAMVDRLQMRVGNATLIDTLTTEQVTLMQELEEAGKTVMIAEQDGEPIGLIAVADQLRPEAQATLTALRDLGIQKTIMLTGDNERTAQAIAAQVGVDEVQAGLLPAQKVAAIESLAAQYGKVAMIGDGINDAPALAAATVGIAMGAAGTDQALEVADIALMADDLSKLPFAVRLSRMTNRTIKYNIGFSIGVKVLFMLLAVPGLATLWMAVFADDGASLLVTGNGLRLLRQKA